MGTTSLPSSTAERQPPFAAGSDSQVRRSSGASFEDRDRSPCKIASTGFIDTRKGDTTPVFKRKQVDFRSSAFPFAAKSESNSRDLRPRSKIAQVVVQNNFLGLSYENSNCVLRIDMKSGRQDGENSKETNLHEMHRRNRNSNWGEKVRRRRRAQNLPRSDGTSPPRQHGIAGEFLPCERHAKSATTSTRKSNPNPIFFFFSFAISSNFIGSSD